MNHFILNGVKRFDSARDLGIMNHGCGEFGIGVILGGFFGESAAQDKIFNGEDF